MFGRIGTCCGDPLNVSATGNQANNILPFLASWKSLEVDVAHRLVVQVCRSTRFRFEKIPVFIRGLRCEHVFILSQPVQIIGPDLHHVDPLRPMLRIVVGSPDGILFLMCKLAFNYICTPSAHFI
jgi:hypothetical protein